MSKIQKHPIEVLGPLPRVDLRLTFHTREEEALIRRLQKIPERRALAVVYERHGCLRCGSHAPHASNWLCGKCRRWAYYELSKADRDIARGELS